MNKTGWSISSFPWRSSRNVSGATSSSNTRRSTRDGSTARSRKDYFGDRALAIFIQPPSVEELRRRLEKRGTDTPEVIADRVAKAEYELTFAPRFDKVLVNDDLQKALDEGYRMVSDFLNA